MAKFKLSFIQDKAQIERLKSKTGGWPFHLGGIAWVETTTHECDDLSPFFYDQRLARENNWPSDFIEGVDSRIIVTIKEPKKEKETNGELPKTKD